MSSRQSYTYTLYYFNPVLGVLQNNDEDARVIDSWIVCRVSRKKLTDVSCVVKPI